MTNYNENPNNPFSSDTEEKGLSLGKKTVNPSPYDNHLIQQETSTQSQPMNTPNQFSPMSPQQKRLDRDALISFVCSLSVLVILWIVPFANFAPSLIGVIYGRKFLTESRVIPTTRRGLGITGLICGYIALLISLIWSIHFIIYMITRTNG